MVMLVVGYSNKVVEAKERALFFYGKVEGKKRFLAVETQPGFNEINESVWVTTIWFDTIEPTPEKEQKEKHEFIGSTDIDPNDPNWYDKWQALQETANQETMAHIADH